uniref:Uncharacterized protein n=1 Tax=Anguilla anguilla TaxID=7936 RepID=A0A0E9RYT3_ANGAN
MSGMYKIKTSKLCFTMNTISPRLAMVA